MKDRSPILWIAGPSRSVGYVCGLPIFVIQGRDLLLVNGKYSHCIESRLIQDGEIEILDDEIKLLKMTAEDFVARYITPLIAKAVMWHLAPDEENDE